MSLNFLAARLCRLMCGRSGTVWDLPRSATYLFSGYAPNSLGRSPQLALLSRCPWGGAATAHRSAEPQNTLDVYGPQEARSGF